MDYFDEDSIARCTWVGCGKNLTSSEFRNWSYANEKHPIPPYCKEHYWKSKEVDKKKMEAKGLTYGVNGK